MILLCLSLDTYRQRRALLGELNVVSGWMRATRGVSDGSAHATFEATAMILLEVRLHVASFPGKTLSVHVDDFKEAATGSGPEEAAEALCEKTASLLHRLEHELSLTVEKSKTLWARTGWWRS